MAKWSEDYGYEDNQPAHQKCWRGFALTGEGSWVFDAREPNRGWPLGTVILVGDMTGSLRCSIKDLGFDTDDGA